LYFYEGMSCPVCNRPFVADEDVVACPQCGLPHHRSCWYEVGHCALADKHGTDEQWSRKHAARSPDSEQKAAQEAENVNICPVCNTHNTEYAEFCAHCGAPLSSVEWQSTPVQPPVNEYAPFQSMNHMGETYSETERIGSVNARDLAAVVGQNTAYYMPRFREIESKKSGGWNWAAFLLGPLWLLYRKHYLGGFSFLAFQIVYEILTMYWYAPVMAAKTQAEMNAALSQIATNNLAIPVFLLSIISLILHIVLGIKGTSFYKYTCETKIVRAQAKTPDISPMELTGVGGTSFALAAVGYFLSNVIPSIVNYLLNL